MRQFVELLVNGLSLGCIDALIALGFVIVFKATRVVNFAYGSLLLLGAYVVGRYHDRLGFVAAVLLSIAVTAAVAASSESWCCGGCAWPTRARWPSSPSAWTSCWPPN